MSSKYDSLLETAKISLLLKKGAGFLSNLALNLRYEWADVGTACTDGRTIWFDPKSYEELTPDQRVSRLAHELWHIALGHCNDSRVTPDMDHKLLNAAMDYVINLMLVKAKYEVIPTWLVDYRFDNMSMEEVYQILIDEDYKAPEDSHNDVKPKHKEADENIVQRAYVAAKANGQQVRGQSVDLDRLIKSWSAPKIEWDKLLKNHMRSLNRSGISFAFPNRRYISSGGISMPVRRSNRNLEDITIAFDVSYSVEDIDFASYAAQVKHIINNYSPNTLRIVTFTTEIVGEFLLRKGQSIESIDFKGRGGTCLSPVFDLANESATKLLIVFSDLFCHKIHQKPKYPVIWVCNDNPNAEVEFGKLIHVKVR